MFKSTQALLFATLLSFGVLTTIVPSAAQANILDFEVIGIAPHPSGARILYVDILDVGSYGCNWHELYLFVDGIHYPINGWNLIGSNGVVARAWFYVPTYFGPHHLQLGAVWVNHWEWSLPKIYHF